MDKEKDEKSWALVTITTPGEPDPTSAIQPTMINAETFFSTSMSLNGGEEAAETAAALCVVCLKLK